MMWGGSSKTSEFENTSPLNEGKITKLMNSKAIITVRSFFARFNPPRICNVLSGFKIYVFL